MDRKKKRNPLFRRIPKELIGDWKKYSVVGLFLILTIGFVSGMYIANDSMQQSLQDGYQTYKLEDGHFIVDEKLSDALISDISLGEKADVKSYYIAKAKQEFDEAFDDEFNETFDREFNKTFEIEYRSQILSEIQRMNLDSSYVDTYLSQMKQDGSYQKAYDEAYEEAYQESYDQAYEEAWNEVLLEVDEEYEKAVKKYDLDQEDFQPVPVRLYENFYRDAKEDIDSDGESESNVRVFVQTEDINLASLLEGDFPKTEHEVAIDRMHAENTGIQVGDTISISGEQYEVTGLIAYVNYATLHEKNTDLMFDAIQFDVAMMNRQGYERLSDEESYQYAWTYLTEPEDQIAEKALSDDFLKVLVSQTAVNEVEINDYIPLYANAAVWFAPEDMGSDKAMGGVLLNVLIVIIAFIFAITITNTIQKESSAVGTLRAMGYTRKELILHYLSMPVIVVLISAVIGNILGYTIFTSVVTGMYYNSYSLPTYHQIFNSEAFIRTTIIPMILMLVTDGIIITLMMRHTPLQFLRHDLKRTRRKKTIRLPKWKFINRFRLRVIFQNIPHYIVLITGILFVSILLAMAVGMPSTLQHYMEQIDDLVFSQYQYVLKSYEDEDGNIITTSHPDAEAYQVHALLWKGETMDEEISVYGISKDSQYIEISNLYDLNKNQVVISDTFKDKYRLSIGDTIQLSEKYENTDYSFEVAGIYDQSVSLAVFTSMDHFEDIFDLEEGAFSGYMSNTEIKDIDDSYIATIITTNDITKMARQLDHSMGSYMLYFQYLCILISAIIIYLLTKIIVEKNEVAISMIKILGYTNQEVSNLYLHSTTIVVLIGALVCTMAGCTIMSALWREIMMEYQGWFTFLMNPLDYLKIYVFIVIGYLLVLIFDYRRIRRIPMDEALKNIE